MTNFWMAIFNLLKFITCGWKIVNMVKAELAAREICGALVGRKGLNPNWDGRPVCHDMPRAVCTGA